MKILSVEIQNKIEKLIIANCICKKYDLAVENISKIIDELYANIPDNKRISYGRVHIVRVLSEYLFKQYSEIDAPTFEIASIIFNKGEEFKSKSVALRILSFIGLADFMKVILYFESAADDDNWDVREMAQMFFKKLIKKYPDQMKNYLLKLVKSESPNISRFLAESLRPVQENRWFYKQPDYPLSILRYLFKEDASCPRTAVGE